MIALLGCPRRAAMVKEIHHGREAEAGRRVDDDRDVDDRGRGGGLLDGAGAVVSDDVAPVGSAVVSSSADLQVTCPMCRELIQLLIDRRQARVRITNEVVDAAQNAGAPFLNEHEARDVLTAAFRAAGFEVEE